MTRGNLVLLTHWWMTRGNLVLLTHWWMTRGNLALPTHWWLTRGNLGLLTHWWMTRGNLALPTHWWMTRGNLALLIRHLWGTFCNPLLRSHEMLNNLEYNLTISDLHSIPVLYNLYIIPSHLLSIPRVNMNVCCDCLTVRLWTNLLSKKKND